MANFAIMRIEKRRDLGAVRRCADHHLRTDDNTANADPDGEIVVLAGSEDARFVTGLIRDRTKPLMRRKDAIRAMDVFCGASPEFFASGGSIRDFEAIALKWAGDTFGVDNVVMAVTHEDELTPHVQMLVTPITPGGRLAASHWLDGPKKLEGLQDTFAAAMQPLGLERGIRGSTAKHEDVKRWYSQLKPMMASAELRIAEAEARIAAAGLATVDLEREKAAIEADRAEVAKMQIQMKRVEEYQQKKLEKVDAKEGRVASAEVAIREEMQKLAKREIALKAAEKANAGERQARIAAEAKVTILTIEKTVLEDDKIELGHQKNVLHNETIELKNKIKRLEKR